MRLAAILDSRNGSSSRCATRRSTVAASAAGSSRSASRGTRLMTASSRPNDWATARENCTTPSVVVVDRPVDFDVERMRRHHLGHDLHGLALLRELQDETRLVLGEGTSHVDATGTGNPRDEYALTGKVGVCRSRYRLPRSHSSTSFPPGQRRGAGSGGVAVTHLVPIRLTRPEWAPQFGFACARIRAFTRRRCGGLAAELSSAEKRMRPQSRPDPDRRRDSDAVATRHRCALAPVGERAPC